MVETCLAAGLYIESFSQTLMQRQPRRQRRNHGKSRMKTKWYEIDSKSVPAARTYSNHRTRTRQVHSKCFPAMQRKCCPNLRICCRLPRDCENKSRHTVTSRGPVATLGKRLMMQCNFQLVSHSCIARPENLPDCPYTPGCAVLGPDIGNTDSHPDATQPLKKLSRFLSHADEK